MYTRINRGEFDPQNVLDNDDGHASEYGSITEIQVPESSALHLSF